MELEMTKYQRACQLWPLLAWAASKSQILTYGEVAKLTGLPADGVGNYLELIAKYCKQYCEKEGISKSELIYLNSIVVNQDTGKPGGKVKLPKGWTAAEAQMSVKFYGQKWLEIPAPHPSDFEKLD